MTEFCLAVLATCAVVEVLHHGALFAGLRARLEARGGFWSELMDCPFCLTHWVAGGFALLLTGTACIGNSSVQCVRVVLGLPLLWFAVVRGANLLNDITHHWNRTPRYLADDDTEA